MHHASVTKENFELPWLLKHRSPRVKAFALVVGIVALSISSYLIIPIGTVPITMQAQTVLLIGAFYGWRWGAATVVLWLLVGAVGLPVFADGGSGLKRLTGPTAGYLFSFPLAAGSVGWLVEHGWNGSNFARALGAMLIGATICLLMGGGWLALSKGIEVAWFVGVQPFLWCTLIESLAAAVLLQVQFLASDSDDSLS